MNCWRGLSGVVCIFHSEILSVAGAFLWRYWWLGLAALWVIGFIVWSEHRHNHR